MVGLAALLDVRRNSDTPGTSPRALSSRIRPAIWSAFRRMMEKAASPGDGGNRAAVTVTVWTMAGGSAAVVAMDTLKHSPRTAKHLPVVERRAKA